MLILYHADNDLSSGFCRKMLTAKGNYCIIKTVPRFKGTVSGQSCSRKGVICMADAVIIIIAVLTLVCEIIQTIIAIKNNVHRKD